MNIDQELYSSNLFYKQLIDQILENERKREELQHQIDSIRREMIQYANQLPYHTMAQTSPYMWRAPYHDFENNYTGYWASRCPVNQQQYEQQCRQNFKAAIDTAAHATKDSSPVASIVFDSVGLMTADNLVEAVIKTLSIIDKARNL